MNTRRTREAKPPAIIHGARALAVLSLIWSGYAITDLIHSGPFGVSVALAGDIGWLTVLWAEYRGIPLFGRQYAAPVAGWLIAIAVGALLVLHGAEYSLGQAIAGPLVVFVGKVVWAFALAALKDPTAPTPEQLAELHAELRDTAHATAMMHARAQGRIERIKAEAGVTLVRDETDFEITLERIDKQAEIQRRTPIALSPAHQAEPHREPSELMAQTRASRAPEPDERPAPKPSVILASSQAAAPEPPAQTREPESRPFGFSAHLTAQSAQRAEGVAKVAELLAQDSGLTSGQVAELLSVSPATAKRYLREARQGRL